MSREPGMAGATIRGPRAIFGLGPVRRAAGLCASRLLALGMRLIQAFGDFLMLARQC